MPAFEWTFGDSIAIYFVLLILLFMVALSYLGLALATISFCTLFFFCTLGTLYVFHEETRHHLT